MKHSRLPNLQEEFSLPFPPAPENRGVAAEYPDANGAQPLVSSDDAKPTREGNPTNTETFPKPNNASQPKEHPNNSGSKCVQREDETKRVSSPNAQAYTTHNATNRYAVGKALGTSNERGNESTDIESPEPKGQPYTNCNILYNLGVKGLGDECSNTEPQDTTTNNNTPSDMEEEGLRDGDDNNQPDMELEDEGIDNQPNMGLMSFGEMAALTQNIGIFSCALVSLLRRPIAFNENLDSRVDVVLVDGPIHMKYSNWTSNGRYTPAPFLVSVPKSFKPVFGCGRFRDYDDFNRRAESNPAVALVRDFCHVTKDKFDLAQRNKGTIVQLAFDLVAYEKAVGKTDFANESMKTLAAQRRKDLASRNVALGTITGGRK